jgi:hypothetical protein
MHTWKRVLVGLTLAGALLLERSAARALQLLSNFGFDTGLAGWATCCNGSGTATWDGSLDNFGSALSGSTKLVHTAALPSSPLLLTRCLSGPDITPGKQLWNGMRVRFAPGESTLG